MGHKLALSLGHSPLRIANRQDGGLTNLIMWPQIRLGYPLTPTPHDVLDMRTDDLMQEVISIWKRNLSPNSFAYSIP
jgi:hypothetical protein